MAEEILGAIIGEGIGVRHGTCNSGMSASTTVIVCADLAGFGNDYFNNKYYVEVLLNANSVGSAPERTQRQITDYVSSTGTFTVTAFGANVEENDKIRIIHEDQALPASNSTDNRNSSDVVGNKADPSRDTVSTSRSLQAYAKGALELLAALIIDITNAVPEPPTANSLQDTLHKDGSFTYDNTTDSLEAIADAVSGVSLLSDKEKSLLGIGVFPGFQDYFDTVANDADPDPILWNVIENGDGAVNVEIDDASKPGYLKCSSLSTGSDGIAYTKDKRVFSLKNGVTTIHLKGYAKMDWVGQDDDECGIGFCMNDTAPADTNFLSSATNEVASIVADSGVPNAHSSDGTLQTTNLSSYISDNTWFLLEIVISASDVKFYIDTVLRATHSTRVPDSVWQIIIGVTNTTGGGTDFIYVEKVKVWGE